VFAAQLNAMVPFPLPEAPDVTVSQGALLLAVQLHPVAVVTLTDPEPAVVGTLWLPDESEKAHCGAGASWLTVNV
jgi:hypothetical protein